MKTLQYFSWVQTKAADDRHDEFTSPELGLGTAKWATRVVDSGYSHNPFLSKGLCKFPSYLQDA